MSAGSLRAAPGSSPHNQEPRELCVVFACHDLVCALPALSVERLVLSQETMVIVSPAANPDVRVSGWQLVMVGEQRYAGCNLGVQLGLPPVDAAWALLRVEHRGMELPIALQIGPCLLVQPLGAGLPLPTPAFRARPGAIAGAFPTQLLRSKGELNAVGLRLDLAKLWTENELDFAAAALGNE